MSDHPLPLPLFTAAQVREMDRVAIEERGIAGGELMRRAGEAAFRALRRRWRDARRLVIVCGVGNNAGDGFVIARAALKSQLFRVIVVNVGDPDRLTGDALAAARAYREAGGRELPFSRDAVAGADVIVDAIFGTGLSRAPEGVWRDAIEAINADPAPVLAVDIPSGLDADTGAVAGVAVRASLTVSFIGLKRGMFTGRGPDCCGAVEFDSLEVPAAVIESQPASVRRVDAAEVRRGLARRDRDAHKGRFGHVLAIGGNHGFAGAVRMAAEAAARTGAGLVSVATRAEHVATVLSGRPELMCRGVAGAADLTPLTERADVIAIGCGLGRDAWAQELWQAALALKIPLVVDADALNLLAGSPLRRDDWILTPHPGEAAQLLGIGVAEVQADRFAAVGALRERFGGTVLLKGAGSLVASRHPPIGLCDRGNPGMASGGMGDVLSGIIAGLLAQGFNAHAAAASGAWLHAMAADAAARADGERGLLASDLFPPLRHLVNP
ncbi:MAG: NAD(P)H-hydrate dehydratase [Gammaproteobacteria bacterium]|nr:NAD(P)H-hydrate dehydratase [Gammaproteobacteria bacterium]